jgi:hypothetical protein
MKQTTGFLGTYFERDSILLLDRWAQIISWAVLVAYTLESGYNIFQSINSALAGGYPVDWFYCFLTLAHVLQGAMIFIVIQMAAKILLILLDIEDNTRRAARANSAKE